MLKYLLSFLSSVLFAAMAPVNGTLSNAIGPYFSTVLIHIVGIIPTTAIALSRKEKLFAIEGIQPAVFLGGAIGVITVVTNNLAFARGISVSAMVALSLFGQTVTSLAVDQFGLLGMPIKRFDKAKLIGLVCTSLGIAAMLYGTKADALGVLLSLLTGVAIVFSRIFNALLAKRTTLFVSTWYNYSVGLLVSALVLLISIPLGASPVPNWQGLPLWAFTGGLMGIVTVSAQNYISPRMSAFRLTLILFIGQIFAGLMLDVLSGSGSSLQEWIGGAFAVIGLSLNAFFDRRAEQKTKLS
ncbi:MAG: DMT family transporter [Clostridiales bacterium]|nr:DMT family transporter [Clostridiales bacterium]